MRGFQPGKARAVPQNYADGGVVSTIKGMLGFGKKKPEPLPADLNKMPPPAAGQAASQPEPPKKAISEYSGMSALERRMKAAGLADGGLVRGPGTGISDDIEDDVEQGTFIMPADSTEAVGPGVMDRAGKAVPVRLSNGETKLPPEALQAIGAQVMEAIKEVTHTPAARQARGFNPQGDDRMNFADGGVVRPEDRPRTIADRARTPGFSMGASAPAGMPTTRPSAAVAPQAAKPSAPLDPQAQSDRAKIGSAWDAVKGWSDDVGRAAADVVSLVPRGVVGAYDSAVARPLRAAGVNADYLSPKLVPDGVDPSSMTPFTDQKRIATEAARQASTVSEQTQPPSATAPPQTDIKKPNTPPQPNPNTPPQAGGTAKTDVREVAPGIYRQGNSYGDSPEAAATGARPSQGPSEYNQAVATALEARDRGMPVPEVSPTLNGATGSRRTISSAVSGGGASPSSTASATAATASRGAPSSGQQPDVMGIYARASEAMKGAAQVQREIDGNQSQRGPGSTFINHSGNDWEAENNLKNLRTSASSIFNKRGPRGAPSVEEMAYMKALDADFAARNGNNPAAIEAMKQQGDIQQTGMRESGENARSGRRDGIAAELGRGQLDLQRNAQGFTTRQLERQEKYQAEYDAAKTQEERATIAQKIRDLSGKNGQDGRYQLVRGEQVYDDKAQALRNTGERLYDTQAGKFVGDEVGATPMPMPKTQDQLKAGQVYDTQHGPAKWDGKQFTAVAG